ncbi:DUF5763 domain-containing protein [Filimonas lacunae]|uniref:DUF5763 domain-containing protein n=1 Tax=Filimonas lacunae TaxID=477680 RepID=UPI0007D731F2|nr:DUF5763 domain-containing protein [Filimonas lacunae]BAV07063.1 hypothetical protein FLA_3083 [Filimonas lacunae]
MKKLLAIFVTLTCLTSFTPISEHHAGKCVGADNCAACKNCSACKYCTAGGTCGVCAAGKSRPKSLPCAPGNNKEIPFSQCKATTKKGTQCSRRAGASGYCWQHAN